MFIKNENIDKGKAFDWGRTSVNYAKYRDIYPQRFYDKIINRGLCTKDQSVLDIGTGTGVLPRHMYQYGASWTGTDISQEQIAQAKHYIRFMFLIVIMSALNACIMKNIRLKSILQEKLGMEG